MVCNNMCESLEKKKICSLVNCHVHSVRGGGTEIVLGGSSKVETSLKKFFDAEAVA